MKVLEGDADAILGVACLDSLEKSFTRIVELGVPHLAVPLLKDGCRDTEAETDVIRAMLTARSDAVPRSFRSYVPLLRATVELFEPPHLARLLAISDPQSAIRDSSASVEAIATDWLREGGKRLRPFVTLACYAIARHGIQAISTQERAHDLIPAARSAHCAGHRIAAQGVARPRRH